LFVFGIYVAIVGAGFLVIPNVLLPIFRFDKTNEVWIRVLGLIVGLVGYYYINAAVHDMPDFYWATCWARFAVFAGFTALVLLKKAKPMLIMFGVVDAAGAVWTLVALLSA
jgi:hypothetical protein